ncbi:nickel pincer cofactor biosynthesis protein LarB [Geopsychrobacter electrodiphilus]|uniref:nickel pincer cofactor biosynthesis protein LarB n=1 Tax=Geopsychrobacter electrodiphilus TaxID=225196 RepID=UPI00039FCBAE
MTPEQLKELLHQIKIGKTSLEDGFEALRKLPFEDIGIAQLDHHRSLRQGVPEVIFGEGKTSEQLRTILTAMVKAGGNILATRLDREKGAALQDSFPAGRFDIDSGTFCLVQQSIIEHGGKVLVVCAGTSDLKVAREAAITARMLGNPVEELIDVGVAGIHRLLAKSDQLREAAVIIVVAGMEGALPSVIGGLVPAPVIAVPTSVGYGAAFGGIAALLGMLTSCASGVTVVNIDNGFGAAFAAHRINRASKP